MLQFLYGLLVFSRPDIIFDSETVSLIGVVWQSDSIALSFQNTMAHEGLWLQLSELEPGLTARRAKCQYLEQPRRYIITFLNKRYLVNPAERQITVAEDASDGPEADFLEQLCILAYLINAKDLPNADKYVGAELLKGGQFFFRGPHALPTERLEAAFGEDPQRLLRLTDRLNAEPCDFGDASIRFFMLPRVPLTVVIWRRCDEFPARATFLFDQTAAEHLPLDALWTAVKLAADALVQADAETA